MYSLDILNPPVWTVVAITYGWMVPRENRSKANKYTVEMLLHIHSE